MTETQIDTLGAREPLLVPGELRAYRIWEQPHAQPMTGLLYALIEKKPLDPAVQQAGKPYIAGCRRMRSLVILNPGGADVVMDDPSHPRGAAAPVESCTCGWYAVGAGGLDYAYRRGGRIISNGMSPYTIAGSVMLSGRVIVGETGVVRAEKMRVEAVISLPAVFDACAHEMLQMTGRLYGVPVFTDPVEFEETLPVQPVVAGIHATNPRTLRVYQQMAHKQNVHLERCKCDACRIRALKHEEEMLMYQEVLKNSKLNLSTFSDLLGPAKEE